VFHPEDRSTRLFACTATLLAAQGYQESQLDPDKWFNNVELVTAETIGIETTTYVRNICKYYAACKLTLEVREGQRKAIEAVNTSR
jgi:hypothetical protein